MENEIIIKYLKLITGEEIIVKISEDSEDTADFMTFDDPMLLQLIPTRQGEQWSAQLVPWLKMADSNKTLKISTKNILIEGTPAEVVIQQYRSLVVGLIQMGQSSKPYAATHAREVQSTGPM